MRLLALLAALVLFVASVDSAPFFDAIYDAINGNGRRSYGYSGYGNSGYSGYGNSGYGNNGYGNYGYGQGYEGYNGYRRQPVDKPARQGKSYKEICRVHFPDSIAVPGAGGIVCPY